LSAKIQIPTRLTTYKDLTLSFLSPFLLKQFVLPRAMPAVRDASCQTSQAEFINPSDWQTTAHSSNRHFDKSRAGEEEEEDEEEGKV